MMVLSRFSMNSAAAARAVICVARSCREDSSSLRAREVEACSSLLFDRLVISSEIAYGEPATSRIVQQPWAVSLTSRCQLAVIGLRMKLGQIASHSARSRRNDYQRRAHGRPDGVGATFAPVTRFPSTEAGP